MKLGARFVVPILLLALFLARIASTYTIFSETSDEHHHIYWGMDWFERGEYLGGDGFQPPLARAAVAFLPYRCGFRAENSWLVHEWENQTLDDFWTSLTLARIGNLFFATASFFASICGVGGCSARGAPGRPAGFWCAARLSSATPVLQQWTWLALPLFVGRYLRCGTGGFGRLGNEACSLELRSALLSCARFRRLGFSLCRWRQFSLVGGARARTAAAGGNLLSRCSA